MSSEPATPVIAVIAAAGAGGRFGAGLPKQYVELDGCTLLERSVRAMLREGGAAAAVVALAVGDERFARLPIARDPRVHAVPGAASRAASVAAALAHVRRVHGDGTWVLVHDAARPLVDARDVSRLLRAVREREGGASRDGIVGGILAARVTDTLKRERDDDHASGDVRIEATVPRAGLWGAQTPQLFRAGPLHEALCAALEAGHAVTDEASAVELAGGRCLLVEARHPNPKITFPADFAVARALLAIESPERTTCA